MKSPSRQSAARGFTLVELMISITLGVLILGAVISVFVGTKRAFRTQESTSEVQEGGRFLSYLMHPYIRLAGSLGQPENISPAEYLDVFRRPDETAITRASGNDPNTAADLLRPIWGVDNAGAAVAGITPKAGTDVLIARYLGRNQIGTAGNSDGVINTCLGLPDAGDPSANGLRFQDMAEVTFFLNLDTPSSLSCRARIFTRPAAAARWTNGPQPLIAGVDDLQFLYGVDTNGNFVANQFFTANNVPNWQQVVSVKMIARLVGTQTTEGSDTADPGNELKGVEDRRLFSEFSSTIQLRNRARP